MTKLARKISIVDFDFLCLFGFFFHTWSFVGISQLFYILTDVSIIQPKSKIYIIQQLL